MSDKGADPTEEAHGMGGSGKQQGEMGSAGGKLQGDERQGDNNEQGTGGSGGQGGGSQGGGGQGSLKQGRT